MDWEIGFDIYTLLWINGLLMRTDSIAQGTLLNAPW